MVTINTIKNNKSAVEIRSELKADGIKVEHIVINNQKIGILGSVSEADRKKAIEALSKVYTDCNGNLNEMMKKLKDIATLEEKEIEHDEVVKVRGKDILLSYSKRKAYTIDGNEIANCDDLPNMPKEAIKAVLIARVEAILK